MLRKTCLLLIIILATAFPAQTVKGQRLLEQQISDSLTTIARDYIFSDTINRVRIAANRNTRTVTVTASDLLGQLPFRKENVERIYSAMQNILSSAYPGYTIRVQAYNHDISHLIPNYFREKPDERRIFTNTDVFPPLITRLSTPYTIEHGLKSRYIALWNSHGRVYNQTERRWEWQRPLLFQSTEDLLTTAFVLPFLVPMLENAGATVFLPRERDIQLNEVIVDNDSGNNSSYREHKKKHGWQSHPNGFANPKDFYLFRENPFSMGSSRTIATIADPELASKVEWIPNIPEKGDYAVYISYQSVPNSTTDAHYTIYHPGGTTEFYINQTMHGGSWLYLGTFHFEAGQHQHSRVELSNLSNNKETAIVSADAVKFGGGMGNIARTPRRNTGNNAVEPTTSGMPRFMEGARYWLQWTGVPDSVYSRTENTNDYSDDFQSRGFWVNYLAGGSSVLPRNGGLNIPVDMALAFHTDAGLRKNDSIVGTLGISTVNNSNNSPFFNNRISRWASRDLVDLIQTEIVTDIRASFHPEWTRRGIWNRSYSESRVPEVPTMLLELLSHQNFEDMKYALDPRFRFTVSRAIYKGILKHLSYVYDQPYVVQPLPVDQFSIRFTDEKRIMLHWKAVNDSLEETAIAEKYIVYKRLGDGSFDNGTVCTSNIFEQEIQPGIIYSFKVTAVNGGGESFPSEILSVYRHTRKTETVLVINGFERISGPEHFNLGYETMAGFLNDKDAGVPYHYDLSFIGRQSEFSWNAPYQGNLNPGFGASMTDYEHKVIAGNTFDYPFIHGKSIKAAGYSFVSASVKSVRNNDINLSDYKAVNLILGKQKQTFSGKIKNRPDFETFPLDLQQKIKSYCEKGGHLMVSGSYVASDITNNANGQTDEKGSHPFLSDVLKITAVTTDDHVHGGVSIKSEHARYLRGNFRFDYYDSPDSKMYYIEYPDIITPASPYAFVFGRYNGGPHAAAVAFAGKYRSCVLGFPFETVKDEESRNKLMKSILQFFFQ